VPLVVIFAKALPTLVCPAWTERLQVAEVVYITKMGLFDDWV